MTGNKKYIFSIFFSILITAVMIGYYQYNKPRQSLVNQPSAVSISASELYIAYQQNETAANLKFLGKVIEVSGKLNIINNGDGSKIFSLATGFPGGEINFQLFDKQMDPSFKKGKNIIVKGKCTGYLMDVNLVDCIVQL